MSAIIVAGLGRCGTSMVMQMLARGGVPCVGAWPSFEDNRTRDGVSPEFVAACNGMALKVLDPHRVGLPGDVRVIWLDRDHRQQAKSHAKFLLEMAGQRYTRLGVRALERGLTRDTLRSMQVIGSRPVLRLRFELLLSLPLEYAVDIGAFIAPVIVGFDAGAAAAAVLHRSAACRPDLSVELSLMGSPR